MPIISIYIYTVYIYICICIFDQSQTINPQKFNILRLQRFQMCNYSLNFFLDLTEKLVESSILETTEEEVQCCVNS